MSWGTQLRCLLLGAALLVGAGGASAAASVASDTSVLSAREGYIFLISRHPRTLWVHVDYEITCQDGTRRLMVMGHDGLGAGHTIRLQAPPVCDLARLRVINLRWDLIPAEKSADERRALAEQLERERQAGRQAAEEAERARKASCGIGPDGRWRDEGVASGRIPLRCYSWYPELKVGAKRYADRTSREFQQLLETNRENAARKAERQRMDAGMAAMRAQEQREIDARQAAQDAATRSQLSEYRGVADTYRNDPCQGARVLRGMPPNQGSATGGGGAALMQQKQREWDTQLDLLDSQCGRAGDNAAAIALQQQAAAAAAAAAEAQRQQRIQSARSEMDRANERGSAVVRQQANELRQLQDDTARLREMLK